MVEQKSPLPDMNTWGNQMVQKWLTYFEKESVRQSIQVKVIDPILKHIMKQVFPYIILICAMFILLLFSTLITLGVIILQSRQSASVIIRETL